MIKHKLISDKSHGLALAYINSLPLFKSVFYYGYCCVKSVLEFLIDAKLL